MSHPNRRHVLATAAAAALLPATSVLTACGSSDDEAPKVNAFSVTVLAKSGADAAPQAASLSSFERAPEFIDAWGIAIRPAGAGGHFWVGAGGYSYQFLGDVSTSSDATLRPLFQDALSLVRIPGAGPKAGATSNTDGEQFDGFTTGVLFNGAPLNSDKFVVRDQRVVDGTTTRTLSGSARFLFATDSGVISGWTDSEANTGAIVRRNGDAVTLIDGREAGHQYFGIGIRPDTWDQLWAADFGAQPQLRAWDANLKPVDLAASGAFANPFVDGGKPLVPGDPAPFNVQALRWKDKDVVVVAYAKTQASAENPNAFDAGEEDSIAAAQETAQPDRGHVAVFDLNGKLLVKVNDDKRLNAPWGVAIAPASYGALAGTLLVGNFGGTGRIAAYDLERNAFVDFMRDAQGKALALEGLWGLQLGNGASLGDADALYYAAGPLDEKAGVFGVLRPKA
jgi:uncharacterized protein (TIGR03118 family)